MNPDVPGFGTDPYRMHPDVPRVNATMNPFANKWVLLFIVAGFLLLVSELVGTGEEGGVLSQVAGSQSADGNTGAMPQGPAIEVIGPEPAMVEEPDEEEVPEEDLPQIISAEQAEDTADVGFDTAGEEGDQNDIVDQPVEDQPAE